MDRRCHDGAELHHTEQAEDEVELSPDRGVVVPRRPGVLVGFERDVQLFEPRSVAQPRELIDQVMEPHLLGLSPDTTVREQDRQGDFARLAEERPHPALQVAQQARVDLVFADAHHVEVWAAAGEFDVELGVLVEHGQGFGVDGAAGFQKGEACGFGADVVGVYP